MYSVGSNSKRKNKKIETEELIFALYSKIQLVQIELGINSEKCQKTGISCRTNIVRKLTLI